MELIAFAGFVWLLARLAGWRPPLPHGVIEALSEPFRRSDAGCEESDSGDSAPPEGDREVAGGALVVSGTGTRVPTGGDRPGLVERWTTWLEWLRSGRDRVLETEVTGPSREERRAALAEHLLRERDRPGLLATRIVRAAAHQPDAPWGDVSEATVWRAWRDLP